MTVHTNGASLFCTPQLVPNLLLGTPTPALHPGGRGWFISLLPPLEDVSPPFRQMPLGCTGAHRNLLLKKRENREAWGRKVLFLQRFPLGQLLPPPHTHTKFPGQSRRAEFTAPYHLNLLISSQIGNLPRIHWKGIFVTQWLLRSYIWNVVLVWL